MTLIPYVIEPKMHKLYLIFQNSMTKEGVCLLSASDKMVDVLIICVVFHRISPNTTIEERVALLEIQVVEIEEDVTGLEVDLTELEGDVNFLFDEQVIQDERLQELEQISLQVAVELAEINVNIQGRK